MDFFDDHSVASNPGKIHISLDKYLEYSGIYGFRKWRLRRLLSRPDSYLKSVVLQNNDVLRWALMRRRFMQGCINPCQILDIKTGLVAAFTDLGNSGPAHPYPVIKIFHERTDLIRTRIPQNGMRIACVAMYQQDRDQPHATHWVNFSPHIPDCFTDDYQNCQRALESIKPEAWKCLKFGLEQIPNLNNPGLYRLDLPNRLVNDAY